MKRIIKSFMVVVLLFALSLSPSIAFADIDAEQSDNVTEAESVNQNIDDIEEIGDKKDTVNTDTTHDAADNEEYTDYEPLRLNSGNNLLGTGASICFDFDFSGSEYMTSPTFSPSETGYYQLQFTINSGSDSDEIRVFVYQGSNNLGFFDVSCSNQDRTATMYMENGKEYTFEIHDLTSPADVGPKGFLDITSISQDVVDEMFSIEGTVLTEYSGNMINIHIPDGVTEINCYYDFKNPLDDYGYISLEFPSSLKVFEGRCVNTDGRFEALPLCGLYVDESNPLFKSIDGIVYSKNGRELIAAPQCMLPDELIIPEGVKVIKSCAFNDGGTDTIILPDTVEIIEEKAFSWTRNLHNIDFGSGLKIIRPYAFISTGLESIEFPSSLEIIGRSAFIYSDDVKSITFNGNTICDDQSLYELYGLESITLNADPVFMEWSLFNLTALENIEIGSKCSSFEFRDGALIQNFDITNYPRFNCEDDYDYDEYDEDQFYLSEYDYELMKDETRLVLLLNSYIKTDFTVDDDIDVVFSSALPYENCPIQNITIGKKCRQIKLRMNLKSIRVVDGNNTYSVKNGVLYSKYDDDNYYHVLVKYPMLSSVTEFVVPSNVDEIEAEAFGLYGNVKRTLTKVSIPEDTSYFGSDVFYVDYDNENCGEITIAGYEYSAAKEYYEDNHESEHLKWMNGSADDYVVSYTIKFNGNGGKASKSAIKIESGKTLGKLPTATRKGYFFLGWYTAKTGGSKITSKTKATANKTYYARWAKAEIENTTVTVKNCTWNGKPQKPAVTVKLKGVALKEGTDFSATYSNNKEVGKGKVVIKGKGVFAKSKKTKSATFTIGKATQKLTAKNLTYKAKEKGKFKKLSVGAKDGAKVTFSTSNKKVVAITKTNDDKKKGDIKLVAPGEATITIKVAATKHYKAATKKIKVILSGNQSISLGASWLKYDKNKDIYTLSSDVWNKSLAVKRKGGVKYTCSIEQAGQTNQAWIESGDCLTAKGSGVVRVKVKTDASNVYPEMTKVFTIKMTGKSMIKSDYLYSQLSGNNVAITKYVGTNTTPSVPATLDIESKVKRKTIIKVGDGAFSGTKAKLTKVTFQTVTDNTLTTIGKNAFKGCSTLTEVRLPFGLTSLGEGAFYGCTGLKKVTLPDGLKTISKSTFENCTALGGTFFLPNSLKTVSDRAFYGCSAIRRVMIYSYITNVNTNAFYGCSGIKNVYYSASESRWANVSFKTGNDPIKNAKMHYNAAAPTTAYTVSDISDNELFADYPEFLNNESYNTVTSILEADVLEELASSTDEKITMSALKTEMQNGTVYCLQAIFEDIAAGEDGVTWSQEKVEESLALDLLRTVVASDEAEAVKDKYMKTFKTVYDHAKIFKEAGDDIFEDNTTRWRFAQELDGYFRGRQASEFNEMLKKIQPYWKQDDSNSKPWTITGVYEGVGKLIDPVDYVVEVLMMNELYSDYVDRIMPYIPEDTSLYRGFMKIKNKMDYPLEVYIEQLLKEKTTKVLTDFVIDGAKESFGFSGTAISVAENFYKVFSIAIIAPTIDDYNNAWLTLSNSTKLQMMLDDVNQKIIDNKGGNISSLTDDQKIIAIMRFEALKNAGKYVIKTMKKDGIDGDEVYMQQKFDRYKDSLNYTAYIRSCKENLVESW